MRAGGGIAESQGETAMNHVFQKRKSGMKIQWKKIFSFLLALMMCMGLAVGCGKVQTYEDDSPTRIYTDSLGREVEIPENLTRVVPSGSLAQIFLFAVAPDSLIAVSGAWSDDAEAYVDEKYMDLPEVGQFFSVHDLNYEEISKMNPQLIIDVGERKDTLEEDLDTITEKTGIPIVHIDAELQTLDETFMELGELYAQYDMEEETKTYYKLFYHSDLTTEQYEKLVEHSILK